MVDSRTTARRVEVVVTTEHATHELTITAKSVYNLNDADIEHAADWLQRFDDSTPVVSEVIKDVEELKKVNEDVFIDIDSTEAIDTAKIRQKESENPITHDRW